MHKCRFMQERAFVPLAASTDFTLAGAAILPSHTAQRPGADRVVQKACVAMTTMQVSCCFVPVYAN